MIGATAIITMVLASAAATAALIQVLMPWLRAYALARPNARSSHKTPTPQGGGFAVVGVTVGAMLIAIAGSLVPATPLVLVLCAAMVVLCVLGGIDDVRPLPVAPRLGLQLACAAALVWATGEARIVPVMPAWIEAAVLTIGLTWFINLTNFMDGIDGITVSEAVPLSAVIAAIGVTGAVTALGPATPLALALAGALLGFAPFNRHVARLFLGDAGSLAIGAALGALLIVLAKAGHLTAAVILPLYYCADATLTLARRWRRGEKLSEPHRTHFYQLATQRGFTVPQVTDTVWALNAALALLAVLSMSMNSLAAQLATFALAIGLVTVVLVRFERGALTSPPRATGSGTSTTGRRPRSRR